MSDNRITLTDLHKLRRDGINIAMLTCYDSSFAALLENAGIDSLLVGDSLGNVLQGHDTTLPVTLADMVYHVGCVARGAKRAFLIGDLPFGSYQENAEQAFRSAAQLMAAGSHMVKLEGGTAFAQTPSSWSSAASRCAPISASRRSRCINSAVSACRARLRRRPNSCSRMRSRWSARAPA